MRVTADGRATLAFTGGSSQAVTAANSPFPVQAPRGETGADRAKGLMAGVTQFLLGQPKAPTYQSLSVRSGSPPPRILAPRDTRLMAGAITFEWSGPPRTDYRVRLTGPQGLVWEQAGIPRRPLPYPSTAPPLTPGARYSLDPRGSRPDGPAGRLRGRPRAGRRARPVGARRPHARRARRRGRKSARAHAGGPLLPGGALRRCAPRADGGASPRIRTSPRSGSSSAYVYDRRRARRPRRPGVRRGRVPRHPEAVKADRAAPPGSRKGLEMLRLARVVRPRRLARVPSRPGPALAQSPPAPAAAPTDETLRRAWDLKAEALRDLQEGRFRDGIPKAREAVALRERGARRRATSRSPRPSTSSAGSSSGAATTRRRGRPSSGRSGIKEAALGAGTRTSPTRSRPWRWSVQQGGRPRGRASALRAGAPDPRGRPRPDAAEVGAALNGLGWVQLDLGDLSVARATLERALRIRERTLGPNHLRTSQTLAHLGRLYRDLGEYDQARATFERALRIQERVLGPDHPDLGYVLTHFGALYERLDDYRAGPPAHRALPGDPREGPRPQPPERRVDPDHARERPPAERRQPGGPAADRARAPDPGAGARPDPSAARRDAPEPGAHRPGAPELRPRPERPRARPPDLRAGARARPIPGSACSSTTSGSCSGRRATSARAQATLERSVLVLRGGGLPEIHWRTANLLGRLHERNGKRVEAAAAYAEAVTVIRGLAGTLAGQQSRAQYLESANRLAVFDSLARVLLRLHERDGAKGYELEALAAIEAKKALLVATTMAAARPTLQDPEARRIARDVGQKRAETTRLERALQAEQGKAPGEQRPERIQELTKELAQTKGEYLAQVQAFLARYPRYRAQFVEQQTVDPEGDREVRGAAAGGDAGRPVLRRAGRALPLRRRRRREVPGPHPGGRAEGPLRPRPRVPHPARARRRAAAAVGGRRVRGLPPRRGAAQGRSPTSSPATSSAPSSRSSAPTRT